MPSKTRRPEPYDYQPIEDYGVIGDLHTVALVGRNGSIDWCCLPHFDSPSLFGALLDRRKGGRWQIVAAAPGSRKQLYFPDTNVLITRFLSPDGVGEVTDCMPIEEDVGPSQRAFFHRIIREVKCVRGEVAFRLLCEPAFNYARDPHAVHIAEGGALFESASMSVGLASPVPLRREGKGVTAEFTLKAGETARFLLRQAERGDERKVLRQPHEGEAQVEPTIAFWNRWLARSQYRGRWREMVNRSALTLKLLTYAPTGAIVAAPTCSLPEVIGGERNWDYRYTWIRDASFTVYAFLRIGFTEEASAFMRWLHDRLKDAGPKGSLQVMYGLDGETDLREISLGHLEGYRKSGPVRVGNAAYKQLQLDIYGEMMDSIYLCNKYVEPVSHELWEHLRHLLARVVERWDRPDEGIWEFRTGKRQFTHSKLMCWVALDRALRLAGKRSLPIDRVAWERTRDDIYEAIMSRGWNGKRASFVQDFASSELDASLLLMPLMKFISPTDPRMLSTLDVTLRELVSDSLVYRYPPGERLAQSAPGRRTRAPRDAHRLLRDGLKGEEGTFSMCTFWLVEALTRAGRVAEARLIFEKMLGYANHLGLYAEEIGRGGEALGNFPQAFTHLGLISAAYNLDRALGRGQ
jgi:GH15 family glucan-1,4-alpha-glucosidase